MQQHINIIIDVFFFSSNQHTFKHQYGFIFPQETYYNIMWVLFSP